MAGRMVTQKTLFLDEIDYTVFEDFTFLINDLASNLDEEAINELQEALDTFTSYVEVKSEGED